MSVDAGTAYVKVKPDFSGLNAEVARQINPMAKDFGGRFGKALGPVMEQQSKHLRTFTTAAKYATVGAAGLAAYGFKDLYESGSKFEKQMDINTAVSEANRREQKKMEAQSLRLGKATFFSANQAAEAQAELVKGGLSVQKVIGGGLAASLSLAEAGELDLATAGETVVNVMGLFGLKGEEAQSVADGLATAANRTTGDVVDFAVAFKQGGSAVKQAGRQFGDGLTILEALAESGIKNSDAGTSMKTAILQLLAPTDKQEKLAKLLNLQFVDQHGNLKKAADLSDALRDSLGRYNNAQRVAYLKTIAGTDGFRTLAALYDAGPKKLEALERANLRQGTAMDIAKTKMDNTAGSVEQFKGSIETAEIQVYQGMAPALRQLADEGAHAADEVGSVFEDPRLSGAQKIEGAFDVLSSELGGLWDRNEMTEHLVDVMDRAIPVVAEHAGTLGFEAAKGFGKGFLHADPLGKAVMGAWLLNFIGGKAAFVGAARSLGLTMGGEIAAGTATGLTTSGAMSSALAGSAGARWLGTDTAKQQAFLRSQGIGSLAQQTERQALAAQGGVFGGIAGNAAGQSMGGGLMASLKRVKWGRIGAIGVGISLAESLFEGIDRHVREGSDDLEEALTARLEGIKIPIASDLAELAGVNLPKLPTEGSWGLGGLQGFKFGLEGTGILPSEAEVEQTKKLKSVYDAMLQTRVRFDPIQLKDIAGQARSLDLTTKQRESVGRMLNLLRQGARLKVGVDAGMDPKKLANIRHGFDFLKHGIGTNMADINRVMKRTGRLISAELGNKTAEGRQLAAKNMKAAVHAIEVQMDRSGDKTKAGTKRITELIRNAELISPMRKQAQGFGREWAKGLQGSKEDTRKGIQAMIAEARKMPGPMRRVAVEAAFEQAKALKQGGDLSASAVKSARSRVLSEWGQLKTGGKSQSKGLADGVIGNVSRMVNTTGSALEIFQENVASALKVYGVKVQQFELKAVGTGGAEQRQQMGGFIVPGSGDGDKFRTMLPAGSFILNREATAAFGFNKGGPLMPVALEAKERAFLPHEVKAVGGPSVLEGWNRAVPRQKGGPIGGVHEPRLVGPDPLRALGQSAIERVFEGGQDYLRKHLKAVSGGDIVAVGHSLQRLDYEVGEHPAFGGVTPGAHVAGSAHYANRAIDVNDDSVPYGHGSGEMESLDWLAPQLDKLKHSQIIWRNHDWDTGAPISGHMDHLHFAMQVGGLIRKLMEGGFVSTAYGPPWDALNGTGVTATGVDLSDAPKKYIVAVDPDVIPLGSELSISPNPFHTSQVFGAEDTGGAIQGNRIDFYDWRGRESQMAWGQRNVQVKDAKGGKESDEHSFKEDVPAVYHGCRTGSIDFPSVPKSLPGIDRELKRWEGEIGRYRAAVKRAQKEKKPGVAQALEHNVTAISTQLNKLRVARHKARFEKAKKALTKRLGKKLGKFARYETGIEGLQRDYNIASQYAEQVVGLEPTQPELPASATDAQREAAEKDFVARFADYVNSRERPAYEAVLGKAGTWRNAILQVEDVVHEQEWAWEGGIRRTDTEIDRINEFSDTVGKHLAKWENFHKHHPKADMPHSLTAQIKQRDGLRDKLPWLRLEDRELRKVLGEARGEFFGGGGKDLIKPPPLPLAGSGALEEHLAEVQGIHWPDQHGFISPLPGKRVAGMFGGAIWETQTAIEELGLKINQAASGLGGGGTGGTEDKDNSDQEELTRQANQRTAVSEAQRVALVGWDLMRQGMLDKLPKAHTGGKITGASINPHREVPVMAQIGESVLTAEETGRLEKAMDGGSGGVTIESIVVHENGRATVRYEGREFEAAVEKVTRKSRGTGIPTPGGARR